MIARLLLVLAFLFAVPAAAQTYPPLSGRVVDAANLLTPEQRASLTQRLEALQTATTRQLVVATVPSLEDRPIEDYSVGLARAWQIGQSQANNGVVLLIAPTERKVRIEVGYGMEGVLTDALASEIIRNDITPHFRDGDYPGGINAGVDAIVRQLQAPPEAAEANIRQASAAQQRHRSGGGASLVGAIIWFIVLAVVIFASVIRRVAFGRRYRRGVSIWGPGGGGSGLGWMLTGAALNSLSQSGRSSSGWGGGGWGGGGGGGFSGGGGSFGGGGASGHW